jgi:polynucleotide 5'-hydroxyl-kinase GRC3/NOL9
MTVAPGGARTLEHAVRSRLTLLLGDIDTGKTSLATFLANELCRRGFRVGVVDADLGQSEIGPPTTIGLGWVRRPLDRLGDVEVVGLFFVGATSPAGHVGATVTGTRRMVDQGATLGCERLLVDTSGLIAGDLGRGLKQAKIERLDPDLVICLERARECEAILRGFSGRARPEILRLPIGEGLRRRSAEARRRHREGALDAYFQGAVTRRLPLTGLGWRRMSDGHHDGRVPLARLDGLEGAIVGLDDAAGDTLGLGAIRAVDAVERALAVDTPVRDAPIAGLRWGV